MHKLLSESLNKKLSEIGAVAFELKKQLPASSEATIEVSASTGLSRYDTDRELTYNFSVKVFREPQC